MLFAGTNIREMAPELRDSVIEQVEHYYGGSYSVSQSGSLEQETAYQEQVSEASVEVLEDVSQEEEEHQEVIQKVIHGQLYELTEQELKWLLKSMDSMAYVSMSSAYDFVNEDYLPLEGKGIWQMYINGDCTLEYIRCICFRHSEKLSVSAGCCPELHIQA